ncbi:MAG: nucleotidyltransferase, partial [Bacteroidota bacterium]
MYNYLQSEFNKFHEKIKLHDRADNAILREKREMLEKELREYFAKKAKEEGTAKITFSVGNQGSYSMGTGIRPLDNEDYDIDVMILLNISKDDHKPVAVKKWVYQALDRSNRTVEDKKPCVRVQYHKNGKKLYHVDLAIYANENSDGKTYLSWGKFKSAPADKKWEISEPEALKDKINKRFKNSDDQQQMKRVIRYLKRWKDIKFKNTGHGKPTGIALTALAYNLFTPQIDRDTFSS